MTDKPTILNVQMTAAERDGAMDALRQLLNRPGEINSGMEEILGGALQKLTVALPADADINGQLAVVANAANLETWQERCVRTAVNDAGLRDRGEIIAYLKNADADSDYLHGQDEALEGLIHSARIARGGNRRLETIINDALQDAATGPSPDEPDAPGF